MKRFFTSLFLLPVLAFFISCEKDDMESFLHGQWELSTVMVSFQGATYMTTSPFTVDGRIVNSPFSSLEFKSQGKLSVDGTTGQSYTFSNDSGVLTVFGTDYPYDLSSGQVRASLHLEASSSVIINNKKLTGSGPVTVTVCFAKR